MDSVGRFLAYHKRDRALYALLAVAVKGYGLSHAHIRLTLHMRKGTCRVADMAHALRIMPQTVGQTLKKCVSMGLMEVGEKDEDDTRLRAYQLTEKGHHVLSLLKDALDTDEAQALLN